MDLAIIRFLFLALAFVKNNQNITNHHLMRQFIWALFLGPFIYINLNIVKRFLPAFFGLDFLALAIFYAILMGLYIKKHELFYFLPGTLERAILISNAGLALFDFNFKTQQVEDLSNNPQGFGKFEILHNLFYSTTAAIEQTFKRGPEGKEQLRNIVFKKSRVLYHTSDNIRWLLLTHSSHHSYYRILQRLSEQIEKDFHEELVSIGKGHVPSAELKNAIVSEFKKIM